MFLSASYSFSQINEDFSWVKKEQIKKVQITSTEDSNRKQFEEIFEYDSNGALVRHELSEDWFKHVKEFNSQGLIELYVKLERFDSELFFDTVDVTYYQYEGGRIKREINREYVVMKGDTSEELSYESIRSWYYEPQVTIMKGHYDDYLSKYSESVELIERLNIAGLDSLIYYIVGDGDTLYRRTYEYKYDKQGRKHKSIEKYISKEEIRFTERTFKYRGHSKILSLQKYIHYNADTPSRISKTIYKYSLNRNIKSRTIIDKKGEKTKTKYKTPIPKYDLKTRLKKAKEEGKNISINNYLD